MVYEWLDARQSCAQTRRITHRLARSIRAHNKSQWFEKHDCCLILRAEAPDSLYQHLVYSTHVEESLRKTLLIMLGGKKYVCFIGPKRENHVFGIMQIMQYPVPQQLVSATPDIG